MEVGLCCVSQTHWTNGWFMASWAGTGSAHRSEVQRCTPEYLLTDTGLTVWCSTVRIYFHFTKFFNTADHIKHKNEKIKETSKLRIIWTHFNEINEKKTSGNLLPNTHSRYDCCNSLSHLFQYRLWLILKLVSKNCYITREI